MTNKEKQSAIITTVLLLALFTVLFGVWFCGLLSPPPKDESGELGALPARPAHLISCLELQRELNRRDPKLKLKEDGICGPKTQAAWDEATNTQYALSLWPEE